MEKENKKKVGPIKVYLTEELFNTTLSVLSSFIIADKNNPYGKSAIKLKEKIMNHGREFKYNNQNNIVVNFYEEEAGLLIKLFIIYNNAIEEPMRNFFEIFHQNKMENKYYNEENLY